MVEQLVVFSTNLKGDAKYTYVFVTCSCPVSFVPEHGFPSFVQGHIELVRCQYGREHGYVRAGLSKCGTVVAGYLLSRT